MAAVNLNVNSVMHRITLRVRVKGVPRLKMRIAVGVALIRFAAWIIGTGIELEVAK